MPTLLKTLILVVSLAAGSAPVAWAQKATEIHIPIGQSPGLSGKHTLIARIQALSPADRSMTLIDATGAAVTVRPDPQTMIWLDRSKLKLPNRKGDYSDCRKDMTVEIKFRNNDRRVASVEWIKVQAAE